MELLQSIFGVLTVFVFFAVSIFAGQFFLRTPWAWVRQRHWSLKMVWMYGVAFLIVIVTSVWVAFVVWLSMQLL